MSGKSTLSDIANAMGLSVATVHRALTGNGRINPDTKRQILETAERMNYHPNLIASSLSSKKRLRLGFVCPDNFFYEEIIEGAKRATNEVSMFGVETDYLLSDGYNPADQIATLKRLLESRECDAVAISPTHNLLLNPLIGALADAGIPAITFNNDISTSSRLSFIGEDPAISGRFAAELYASILEPGDKIAVMRSLVSAEGLTERVNSFKSRIEQDGRVQIEGVYDFYDHLDSSRQIAEQILLNTGTRAIFANSMIGSLGVGRAIRETGRRAFVIGYDLNAEMRGYIEDGTLYGTLFQSPYKQGYYAIKVLYKALTGNLEAVKDTSFHIPTQLLLNANLDQASRNYATLFSELD